MKKISSTLLGLSMALAAASAHANDKQLVIGTNNWAENIAVANMWKIVLEEEHGYEIELTDVGKSVLYSGLANNDFDISLEIWLPTTDKEFLAPYKDKIDVHDVWYEGTGLGIVVPSYVEIDTIDALRDSAEQFSYQGRSTIIGIDSGSAIAGSTDDAIDAYDLPMRQLYSSDPAMMAALDDAYQREEPIAVTLWSPHWAFAEYDLKYLEDTQGVYGESDDIFWFSRKGFAEDDPWLTQVLNEWHMDDDTLGGLMATIEQQGDPVEGARTWIGENRELVDTWLAAGE